MVYVISHFSFGLKWNVMVQSRKKEKKMKTTDAQNKLTEDDENWDFLLYFLTFVLVYKK